MKILVFHQPFPMGNYKLNTYLAKQLENLGHDVYVLEQLNGRTVSDEYVQQIIELDLDVVYYEMLDVETFKIVEKLDCKKILCFASKGILDKHENIVDKYGKWYTHMMVNSDYIYDIVSKKIDSVEHFGYYFSCLDSTNETNIRYNHDCVFLGQGFHRLSIASFYREREMFFNRSHSFDFKIYGSGWPTNQYYGGILPPDDIEVLYTSAKCGISVIEADQYPYGMINNRYTEMAVCGLPILTLNYDGIDWYGATDLLNFVETYNDVSDIVSRCINKDSIIRENSIKLSNYMKEQHKIFFQKLENLINE